MAPKNEAPDTTDVSCEVSTYCHTCRNYPRLLSFRGSSDGTKIYKTRCRCGVTEQIFDFEQLIEEARLIQEKEQRRATRRAKESSSKSRKKGGAAEVAPREALDLENLAPVGEEM